MKAKKMTAPPPLVLQVTPQLDPFIGCEGIWYNANTRVLHFERRMMTPTPIPYEDLIEEFIRQYNNITNCQLVKRHILFGLLATIDYTRTDIHELILELIRTGNLPIKMQ